MHAMVRIQPSADQIDAGIIYLKLRCGGGRTFETAFKIMRAFLEWQFRHTRSQKFGKHLPELLRCRMAKLLSLFYAYYFKRRFEWWTQKTTS